MATLESELTPELRKTLRASALRLLESKVRGWLQTHPRGKCPVAQAATRSIALKYRTRDEQTEQSARHALLRDFAKVLAKKKDGAKIIARCSFEIPVGA